MPTSRQSNCLDLASHTQLQVPSSAEVIIAYLGYDTAKLQRALSQDVLLPLSLPFDFFGISGVTLFS